MDKGKVIKTNFEAKIKEMNEKIKSLKHKNKVMASLGAKDIDFMRNLQEIAYLKLKVIEYTSYVDQLSRDIVEKIDDVAYTC